MRGSWSWLLWLVVVCVVGCAARPATAQSDYKLFVQSVGLAAKHVPAEQAQAWTAMAGVLGKADNELITMFADTVPKPVVRSAISALRSAHTVQRVAADGQRLASALSSHMQPLHLCMLANTTLLGCDVAAAAAPVAAKFDHLVASAGGRGGGGAGTRPAAPSMRFSSAHFPTPREGEGMVTLSRRFFFWLSLASIYGLKTQDLAAALLPQHKTEWTQRRERWKTIFAITPTFNEWKRSLSAYDHLELVVSELCMEDIPDAYTPFKREGVEWNKHMTDLDLVWASPIMNMRQEFNWTEVRDDLQMSEGQLRECWDRAVAAYSPKPGFFDSVGTRMSLLGGIFFSVLLLIASENYTQECGAPFDPDHVVCSSRFTLGSVCVRVCPDGEIDWGSADSTGQMVVCGPLGEWVGVLPNCKDPQDYRYR